MTAKYEEQIERILDNFDFDKVKKVMECLEWAYIGEDDPPSHRKLIKMAEDVLKSVSEKEDINECSCGGFVAKKEAGELALFFQIEGISYSDVCSDMSE